MWVTYGDGPGSEGEPPSAIRVYILAAMRALFGVRPSLFYDKNTSYMYKKNPIHYI